MRSTEYPQRSVAAAALTGEISSQRRLRPGGEAPLVSTAGGPEEKHRP
ncbi:hypothetical protein ABT025_19755 [Streptomyces sp. NPDC002809]